MATNDNFLTSSKNGSKIVSALTMKADQQMNEAMESR